LIGLGPAFSRDLPKTGPVPGFAEISAISGILIDTLHVRKPMPVVWISLDIFGYYHYITIYNNIII
jgi:hypothetical protein